MKGHLKGLHQRYARAFRSFGPDDLERVLRALGIAEGDRLLVHSSFDAFVGFKGKPTDIISVLQRVLTPRGLLLMPTIPFTGTAVDHVARHPVFDLARTPSRVGLLTELFRRTPGVVRSVHPTHAVAAWGDDAASFCEGHHAAATPCGAGSPYARLLERDGKVLLAGADIDSLTLYHAIEETLEARFPVSPFTREIFSLASRLPDGTTLVTTTRLFEPAVSRRRNLFKLVPELKSRGAWHEGRVGSLRLTVLRAADVAKGVAHLAAQGVYCYD